MKTTIRRIKPKFFLVIALIASTLIVASSCKVPGMHRPSLQQGNLLTQDMVNELEPGMTKEQVEFVLGRPVHLNTFNIDQWDYVYTFEDRRGNTTRRHLSVTFENDVLAEIGGDYKPSGESEEDEPESVPVSELSESLDEDPFQSPTEGGQDTD